MPEFAELPVQQQFPYDDPEAYDVQFDEEEDDDVADVADVPGVTGNRNQDFLVLENHKWIQQLSK